MVRNHEIPRNAAIDGVKCRVWYKGLLLNLTTLWHLIKSWRPLSCLRPPSVLDEMVVAPSLEVEEVPASFQAPSEMSGGGMKVASLDLRDYELDEVASQPMVLSEESLFDSGSESFVRGKGHLRTGAASALVSPEETSELFKSLKAVLRCFH